jgi:hypothetical protein
MIPDRLRNVLGQWLVVLAMLAAVLALGFFGIGRSLWTDEAWVANSIRSKNLQEMFHYSEWLQTSPPLFLLLSRAAFRFLGMSNAVFRAVPLAFAAIAAVLFLRLSLRVLPLGWASLAGALVVFHPAFVEYSHSAKQYSGEVLGTVVVLAAAFSYLQEPGTRRFVLLAASVSIALMAAYPVAFLIPGVLLVMEDRRRRVILAGTSAATLLVLWFFFVRGNTAPELRAFWAAGRESLYTPGLIAATLFALGQTVWAVWSRSKQTLLFALPCVWLAAANLAGWYPAEQRMRLWVLPCIVLLILTSVRSIVNARAFEFLAFGAAVVVAIAGVRSQIRDRRELPIENYAAAVGHLKGHAGPNDLVVVHAATREGFRLYADMDAWSGPEPRFGNTGWPCCARGRNAFPGTSSEQAVSADLDRLIPPHFHGRVWLMYPTRPTHWRYTGLDEGNLWRKKVWEKGCPPEPYLDFHNLALSPMFCR